MSPKTIIAIAEAFKECCDAAGDCGEFDILRLNIESSISVRVRFEALLVDVYMPHIEFDYERHRISVVNWYVQGLSRDTAGDVLLGAGKNRALRWLSDVNSHSDLKMDLTQLLTLLLSKFNALVMTEPGILATSSRKMSDDDADSQYWQEGAQVDQDDANNLGMHAADQYIGTNPRFENISLPLYSLLNAREIQVWQCEAWFEGALQRCRTASTLQFTSPSVSGGPIQAAAENIIALTLGLILPGLETLTRYITHRFVRPILPVHFYEVSCVLDEVLEHGALYVLSCEIRDTKTNLLACRSRSEMIDTRRLSELIQCDEASDADQRCDESSDADERRSSLKDGLPSLELTLPFVLPGANNLHTCKACLYDPIPAQTRSLHSGENMSYVASTLEFEGCSTDYVTGDGLQAVIEDIIGASLRIMRPIRDTTTRQITHRFFSRVLPSKTYFAVCIVEKSSKDAVQYHLKCEIRDTRGSLKCRSNSEMIDLQALDRLKEMTES